MVRTKLVGILIILSLMLAIQAFSATQSGTFTNIYNNILPLSFAQSPNAPAAPSIPRPIPPPSQDSPISPPPTVDQGNTENGDGGNGTSSVPGTGYSEYTNDVYGISFKYPSAWDSQQGDLKSSDSIIDLIKFYIPNSDSRIVVGVTPESSHDSVFQYAETEISFWKKHGYSPTVINASASLGGHPAYQFLVTQFEGYSMLFALTLVGNSAYVVDYAAPESSYKANLPIVEDFIKSIKIIPR